jgi:hypothetical protein
MASQNMDKEKDKMWLVGAGGLAVLIALVVGAKYLPALFLGLVLSFFITGALKSEGVSLKIINTSFNILFLMSALFFFFGQPFDGLTPHYNGFLPYPPLYDLVGWFISTHDSILGAYKTTLFQNALINDVNAVKVSQALWLSLPISVLSGSVFYFFGEKNSYGSVFGGVGVKFFSTILRAIQYPIRWSMTVPWNPLSSLLVLSLSIGVLSGIQGVIDLRVKPTYTHVAPIYLVISLFGLAMIPFIFVMFAMFVRTLPLIIPGGRYIVSAVDFILSPLYNLLCLEIPSGFTRRRNLKGSISLGRDLSSGKEVILTEKNLNYHTQVVGGSGAGKTNLIKKVIADKIHNGSGLIFLDLKADFDTVEWISRAASSAGRLDKLKILSLTDADLSLNYNPMKRGGVSELHSKIMNSIEWSEEYYRKASSQALHGALTLLCERRDRYGLEFDLFDVYEVVSFSGKVERMLNSHEFDSKTVEITEERIEGLRKKDGFRTIQGLSTDLYNLTRSAAGPMLGLNSSVPEIDIFESICAGDIVYFLMDSMSEKESSEMLGRILLQDLIQATGQIYKSVPEQMRTPAQVIIDEFASFATPNFIDFINRARGAGLGIMVAHQSRGDLREVSDNFCDRLERNCGTKLIFGTDNDEDAEAFASMVGTRTTSKDTQQMEQGWFSEKDTGMISRREVEEFIVHPNEIKNLGQGEVLRISRLVDTGMNLTKIHRAPEFEGIEAYVNVYERNKQVDESQNKEIKDEIKKENTLSPNDGGVFV